MAQLIGLIISDDDSFRAEVARHLRSGVVPVRLLEHDEHENALPDLVIVDVRAGGSAAMSTVEELRGRWPAAGIVAVASAVDPNLIIEAMRAGANEFFAWPPQKDAFEEAMRRLAARRASSPSSRTKATTIVFFGAKGGAGTTTMAVNTGVEIARVTKRPTIVVDLKAGLGEVTLFLGVRSRYTLLDALDNLHRLDNEFMRELVVKHKSSLEILAGSDQFDRPGSNDSSAIEEVFRLLGRQYEYIVIDAGSHMGACTDAALYMADSICLVANPDVPSIRNAQRLIDRMGQLGPSGDRIKLLLNRAAEPYPIPPAQIENALGHKIFQTFPSDYKTVSTALNSGVPLASAGNGGFAAQFDNLTRRLLNTSASNDAAAPTKRLALGLERIASIW